MSLHPDLTFRSGKTCRRQHKCCECLHYHRKQGQLPACFFTAEYEQTYDRSIANFIRMHGR